MKTEKGTTPKALQIKLDEEGTNNGIGESFKILYYGSAAAGSVPFMWESQPGTPKHALTESSLPPLTPPPSYYQRTQKYNSSMHMINHNRSGFLSNFFVGSSRNKNRSYKSSWLSTPMSKTEVRRQGGGGSPTETLCLGGGLKRSYRIVKMKNAMLWFVRHGKAA